MKKKCKSKMYALYNTVSAENSVRKNRVLLYGTDDGSKSYAVSAEDPAGVTMLSPILWNVMYDGVLT